MTPSLFAALLTVVASLSLVQSSPFAQGERDGVLGSKPEGTAVQSRNSKMRESLAVDATDEIITDRQDTLGIDGLETVNQRRDVFESSGDPHPHIWALWKQSGRRRRRGRRQTRRKMYKKTGKGIPIEPDSQIPSVIDRADCARNYDHRLALIHLIPKLVGAYTTGYDEKGIINATWVPLSKISMGFFSSDGVFKISKRGAYHMFAQVWYHSRNWDPTSEMGHCIVVGNKPDLRKMEPLVCSYSQPGMVHPSPTEERMQNFNTKYISISACLKRNTYVGLRMYITGDHQAQKDCIGLDRTMTYFGANLM